MVATQRTRPAWYSDEDDTAWSRVKAAFRRDWEQTKHDMGANAPDLDQNVDDTVAQAVGSKPVPPGNAKTPDTSARTTDVYSDDDEPAYRYGYAASRHFDQGDWDDDTEAQLRKDWGDQSDWDRRRAAIRRGWTYGKQNSELSR